MKKSTKEKQELVLKFVCQDRSFSQFGEAAKYSVLDAYKCKHQKKKVWEGLFGHPSDSG